MKSADPVTAWIAQLKVGEQDVARQLWDLYFPRLLAVVRKKLPNHLRRAADEEDIALSAFRSFCSAVAADRFVDRDGTDDLWGILFVVASRKTARYLRSETRQKRGGGSVRGDSGFVAANGVGPDAVVDTLPTPDEQAVVAEQCDRLLERLGNDLSRNVARLKLEGHTLAEIATRLGITHRAVQRRLDIIRRTWRDELAPNDVEDPE